jgi:hypothetical protein
LPQEPAQGRAVQEIFSVGSTDCGPLVTDHNGASTRIDHDIFPLTVNKPVSWQLMETLESSIGRIQVDSSFVTFL